MSQGYSADPYPQQAYSKQINLGFGLKRLVLGQIGESGIESSHRSSITPRGKLEKALESQSSRKNQDVHIEVKC
ncbi:hypothetical protein SO802_033060 [Lithocarpus litseifolius]|uniref:Uncharacterized protein n=1 Tax=Lithocarpus litseifolius TaxID=425828 RepID=A0AAW2BHE7_9ROSI